MDATIYDLLGEELSREVDARIPNGGRFRITQKTSSRNPNTRKDRNKAICKDRLQGLKVREISEKFNLAEITIKKILKENGLTTKKERINIIEEIKMMIKMGMPKRAIAKKLKISPPTLYAHMKRGGIQ